MKKGEYFVEEILPLTSRELETLRLLAEERNTNKEIGKILHITEKTVAKHVEHIFQKMGVRNRLQAVLKAWRYGLIDRPEKVRNFTDVQERSFR